MGLFSATPSGCDTRGGTASPGTTITSDYLLFPTYLIIPAGASSGTITVQPFNDTAVEASETVILTLTANAYYTIGSPNTATVTIQSDEKPTVTVGATVKTATELPTATGRFTIYRSGSTSAPLTVYYSTSGTATPGNDYTALSGSVTIPAGFTSEAVYVTPKDDGHVEAR